LSEIDLEKMEKLIGMMIENDLTELQYKHGELEVELKRGGLPVIAATPVPPITAPTAAAQAPAAVDQAPPEAEDENAGLIPIISPMVGTFYTTPDPDSPAYVSVGSSVSKETVVCIIEAMKVFNEIKADVDGTIEKIVATNSEAVEYGQTLYYVRPR